MISLRLVDFGDSQTVRKGVEGMNMSTQSHPGLLLSYVLFHFFDTLSFCKTKKIS